jgi:hypothetical protein
MSSPETDNPVTYTKGSFQYIFNMPVSKYKLVNELRLLWLRLFYGPYVLLRFKREIYRGEFGK